MEKEHNKKNISKLHKIKVNILCFILLGFFSALIYQLVCIQIIDHQKYSSLASSQQIRRLEIPTRRGSIFDRNGVKLAESIQVSSVFADPSLIEDKAEAAKIISDILDLKYKKIVKLLNKQTRFVWIKRRIKDEKADEIRKLKADELEKFKADEIKKLKLKGICLKHEYKRVYPLGKLGSHILGFADIDEKGLAGIEKTFDSILSGDKGYKIIETDGRQHHISMLDGETVSARYGDNVYLTIDHEIQAIVEDELEKAFLKWNAKSATAIVMDPFTGEVLAMANNPSYDPNLVYKSTHSDRRNRAITDCFEPGSLIKPIIVCGALDSGLVRSDDIISCHNGKFIVGKRVITDSHPYGDLTISEIVINSSNIGMAQLGMKMQKEMLFNHLKKFSFGKRTGISLPGEVKGKVWPLKYWTVDSEISVTFGYEMTATPLQLVTAFSSIANGGTLLRPRIYFAISDFTGKKIKKRFDTPERVRRVISQKTSLRIMNPILEEVVRGGTGKRAGLDDYRVAGKTGTAKKTEGGKYVEKYIGSFIGYAPVDSPRICVLVTLNEPKNGAYYGGTVAAPVVKNIIGRSLRHMRVAPQYVLTAQR